ncbi:MAG: ferredoxin family protein [Verrucomicrobiota bacterium]|jgi:Pyruvate/2-oxoacid:ferredoxin oxidoreductase delta subunit
MSLADQTTLRVVLYEGVGGETLDGSSRFQLMSALLERGFAVTHVAEEGNVAPADRCALLVLGRFGEGHSPEMEDRQGQVPVRCHDIQDLDSAQVVAEVERFREQVQAVRHGEWKPWFPVIDYDRCTNCMQCLSFCLFGVYGVDPQQRIQVQHNDNCKTNCPACSRVCPEAAIMFPKYKAGPINGDWISEADLQREKMKIDISALLGGDVYQMLRERSERAKSRFSKERDSEKALKERQKCLVKLAQAGDIPPEVLMSLPSPDEIQRRAEEAKARAQAALQRQPSPASTEQA